MSNTPEQLIGILNIHGVGPRRTLELVNEFGSLDKVYGGDTKSLCRVPGITPKIAHDILNGVDLELVAGQVFLMEKFGVKMLSYWDAQYPELLKQIYDPPIVLFCRGDQSLLQERTVSIVGTRTPTTYGKEVAAEFAAGIAQTGTVICSGAAKGIDTIAHRSVLRAGGKTIAVLGNGLDRVYPAENRKLYEDLAESGLLISEFMMGTGPDAPNFPRRNRVISGLVRGVVVVEAAERSGSLITARLALEQGREVFAVPGPITSPYSRGTHALLRQGARLLGGVEDIFEELNLEVAAAEPEAPLGEEERLVLEHLSLEPVSVDRLVGETGLPAERLASVLALLEMKDRVRDVGGGRVVGLG